MSTQSTKPNFSDGFTEENDIFSRVRLYNNLIKIIKYAPEENLVLALDDRWGNGKTSFIKMMEAQIKKEESENINVIYFDAFENDYQSDPFISITSQFYSLLENDSSKLSNYKDEFLAASKKVGAALLFGGIKAVISAATAGVVNGGAVVDSVKTAIEGSADKISSDIESFIEKKITSAHEEKQNIEFFRTTLEKIHENTGKKTVFLIDELDRAIPNYSLDLLEKIKHLFSVKGVIFILIMNRSQFEKNIEKRYGAIDSSNYLNKFINYYITLPKADENLSSPGERGKDSTVSRYLKSLNDTGRLTSNESIVMRELGILLGVNNCSLREAERCYALLKITSTQGVLPEYEKAYDSALAVIIYLKVNAPKLLERFIRKEINYDDFIHEISLDQINDQSNYVPKNTVKVIRFHYLTHNDVVSDEQTLKDYTSLFPRSASWGSELISPFTFFYEQLQLLTLTVER